MLENISGFGVQIEKMQRERGINNVQLAKLLGIKHQNVSQLKRSKNPRFSTVRKLVEVLKVGSDYFSPYV